MLVVEEVERELVAVAPQEPPRPERVASAGLEHVAAHNAHDALPQLVRVPEAQKRAGRELGAYLVVAVLGKAGLRVVVKAAVLAAPGG